MILVYGFRRHTRVLGIGLVAFAVVHTAFLSLPAAASSCKLPRVSQDSFEYDVDVFSAAIKFDLRDCLGREQIRLEGYLERESATEDRGVLQVMACRDRPACTFRIKTAHPNVESATYSLSIEVATESGRKNQVTFPPLDCISLAVTSECRD